MLLQTTNTLLFLLPLIPLVGLLIITILLRPACHNPNAIIGAPQACEAYKLLAFIMDVMIAFTLVFVIVLLWCRGKLTELFEPDLESLSTVVDTEQDAFVDATERDPLISRARGYTFRVRQLPFLSHYGTMPDMEADERALLSFYHFPEAGVSGSLDSSGSSSFASAGTTVGTWGMPLSESPDSLASDSLKRVSLRPFEEAVEGGRTKWSWRLSSVGMSVSPTGATTNW